MFLEPLDLDTVLYDWAVMGITTDQTVVHKAILAAMGDVESYLSARYDTKAIFAMQGDNRPPVLLEHTKSIAAYYLCRLSNSDINYQRIKDYKDNAMDWLSKAAGIAEGKAITPNLPLLKRADGTAKIKMRSGSTPKFNHHLS